MGSFSRFFPQLRKAVGTTSRGKRRRTKTHLQCYLQPRFERLEDRITPTTHITFAGNVLTIGLDGVNETATLSVGGVTGTLLSVISNDPGGTTADAGAVMLGFAATTNGANTGNIAVAAPNDVQRIDITGTAAANESVDIQGGAFTALNIIDGNIANVTFDMAPSTFVKISGNAATADLNVVTNALTVTQEIGRA